MQLFMDKFERKHTKYKLTPLKNFHTPLIYIGSRSNTNKLS